MAEGLSKPLPPCLSPAMESGGCLQTEDQDEEEDSFDSSAGRKACPVPVRDDTGVSIWCAWLRLGDGECPLLGVAVLSHPHELTLLTGTLGCDLSNPMDW